MRPFILKRASTLEDASFLATDGVPQVAQAATSFLAGGTTLVDLMKLDVMRPDRLIDISRATGNDADQISVQNGALRLGSLVKMSAAANHADVQSEFPVIAQSLALAASAQLRNMASLGGNVLQRTRCPYFRDVSYQACNKRNPGSGCAAIAGHNRLHAVLGASDYCIAVYPGDFSQALIALGAEIEIAGRSGVSRRPFADLHRLPGSTPDIETSLALGEIIIAFHIPASAFARRSRYVKVRDRESYEFALASAAIALDISGGIVREARVALGGVATKPWRAQEAEAALKGKRLDETSAAAAADAAFAGAKTHGLNAFKIPLGKSMLARALLETAAMEI